MTIGPKKLLAKSDKLEIFENPEFGSVRVIEIDGEPWWVLADVCRVLGLSNPTAVASRLSDDERAKFDLGRQGKATIINEPGLYKVILRSDKPNAEPFMRWITHEVIPSIRKHGAYMTPEKVDEILSDPDTIIRLATQVKVEREKRLALEAELDRSKEWYSIKRVAAINGCDWRKFDWKKLKSASIRMGYGVKKIFDANYGEVNTYHMNVWESVYPTAEL